MRGSKIFAFFTQPREHDTARYLDISFLEFCTASGFIWPPFWGGLRLSTYFIVFDVIIEFKVAC